jgi:chemotaxis protein CheD
MSGPFALPRLQPVSESVHERDDALRMVKVFLGHHAISADPAEVLVTTLGSCVSACLWDPVAGIGGMNHFLLPDVPTSETCSHDASARYGSVAMERLINALLMAGGRRERLHAKVFGGARVIESSMDIGEQNGLFALDYLRREGIRVTGQDLGGPCPRRVLWFPTEGRALRRLLTSGSLHETVNEELRYRTVLRTEPQEGAVELFNEDHP